MSSKSAGHGKHNRGSSSKKKTSTAKSHHQPLNKSRGGFSRKQNPLDFEDDVVELKSQVSHDTQKP